MTSLDPLDLTGASEGWMDRVHVAAREYNAANQHYDDVFVEVSDRLAAKGFAGKLDVAVLTSWKRSAQGAWVKDFLVLPEADVRSATETAFGATDDAERFVRCR